MLKERAQWRQEAALGYDENFSYPVEQVRNQAFYVLLPSELQSFDKLIAKYLWEQGKACKGIHKAPKNVPNSKVMMKRRILPFRCEFARRG